MLPGRKHALLAGLLIAVALAVVAATQVHGNLGGSPDPGQTGAPPAESTCYADPGCHAHGDNGGDRTDDGLLVEFSAAEYAPDQNITVTVTVTGDSFDFGDHGFEVVVLDGDNSPAGSLNITDQTNTTTDTDGARTYVMNSGGGHSGTTGRSWTFNWTAADNYGDVIFYATGISAANLTQPEWEDITWARSFLLPQQNRAPELRFPSISENHIGIGEQVSYSVIYRDLDGDIPSQPVTLIIDGGTPKVPDGDDDGDVTIGRTLTWFIDGSDIGLGRFYDHNYTFNATDGEAWATGDGANLSFGPKVNDLPVLANGTLTPDYGNATTLFNLTVEYRDPNGIAPEHIWYLIDGNQSRNFTLYRVGGNDDDLTDGDYSNGELFYNVSTFALAEGFHALNLRAEDGIDFSNWENVTLLMNDRPVIYNGSLSANSIGEGENVTLSVTYRDTDNHTGTVKAVLMGTLTNTTRTLERNGTGALGDGNYTNGERYTWTGSLAWDNYTIWFIANDTYQDAANTSAFSLLVNDAPALANGGLIATGFGEGDTYVFNVTYTDPNAGQTASVWVTIDGNGTFVMVDSGGGNYTYTAVGLPWGQRDYNFSAQDQYGADATGDTAPHVLLVNDAPALSNASVDPTLGPLSADYNFTVTVRDPNYDDAQPLAVMLYIDGAWAGLMSFWEGTPADANGTNYTLVLPGNHPLLGGGTHSFVIRANDTLVNVSTAVVNEPTVNYAPTLTDLSVTPPEGWTDGANGTRFNFTLTYTDGDATAEPWVGLEINGTLYSMTWLGDGNLTAGRTYWFEINATEIGLGNFAYTFWANDTVDNISAGPFNLYIASAPADLAVVSLAYERADGEPVGPGTGKRPIQDRTTTVRVAVTNAGLLNATNIDFNFTLGGVTYWYTQSLGPGEDHTFVFDHVFTVAGDRTATYLADPNATIDEHGQLANNTLTHTVTVLPLDSGQPFALTGNFTYAVDGSPLTNATLTIFNATANTTFTVNSNYTYDLNVAGNLTFREGDIITLAGEWIDGTNYTHTSDPVTFAVYSEDTSRVIDFVLGRLFGVNLTDTIVPDSADPGLTVSYLVTVNNTGNTGNDTYTLATTTLRGWAVRLLLNDAVITEVNLTAGENVTITIEVTVVADALAGDLETVTLTATSQGNPAISDSVDINTAANQVGGITIDPVVDDSELRTVVVSYRFNLTNTGNGDDNYTLGAVADDAANWTLTLSADWIVIAHNSSAFVWVNVTVPDLRNGTTDTFTLIVVSNFKYLNSTDTANATTSATTTVERYASVTVTLLVPTDQTAVTGTLLSYTFNVTNDGNEDDTFTLVTTADAAWSPAWPASVGIPYQGYAWVVVNVTVPDLRNGTSITITLNATSTFDANATDEDTGTATTARYAGVTVSLFAPLGQTALDGTLLSYIFNVTNDGNEDDTFDLDVVADAAWNPIGPTVVAIPYRGYTWVTINVTVPDLRNGTTTAVFLSATSVFDNGSADNDTGAATVARYTGLVITGFALGDAGQPGDDIAYWVNLTNTGNDDDWYDLTPLDEHGWTTDLPAAVWVDYGGWTNLTFMLTIRGTLPLVPNGTIDTLDLALVSQNGSATTGSVAYVTTVTQIAFVSVTIIEPSARQALPGETTTYIFLVMNNGNARDTFDLTVDGHGWAATTDPTVVTLNIHEPRIVTVTHVIPGVAGAPDGTSRDVTLTATSQQPGGASDTDGGTSNVTHYHNLIMTGEPLPAVIYPDDSLALTLEIINRGNGNDTALLSVSGEAADWATLAPSVVLNGYGSTANPILTINIPRDRPSESSSTLRITALAGGSVAAIDYKIDIAANSRGMISQFLGLTANTLRLNPGSSQTVHLQVFNLGHVASDFQFLLFDVSGAGENSDDLLVGFSTSSLEVPDGGSSVAGLSVGLPVSWDTEDEVHATFYIYSPIDTNLIRPQTLIIQPNLPLDTSGWDVVETDGAAVYAGVSHSFTLEGPSLGRAEDDYTINWDFGDGTVLTDVGLTVDHTFVTSGDHTVTVTLTDDLGQTTIFTGVKTVQNAPPEVGKILILEEGDTVVGSIKTAATTIEGAAVHFTLNLKDIADTDGYLILVEVDFGDGSKQVFAGADLESNTSKVLYLNHIYATSSGSAGYSVKIRAVDNHGDESYSQIQNIIVKERKNMMTGTPAWLYGGMLFSTWLIGILLMAAAITLRRNQSTPLAGSPEIAVAGLTDEDRDRLERMEDRIERLAEREELMEVSAYDASRVATKLDEHLKAFRQILTRAQELAAQDRLLQLERELEEKQREEELEELDRLEPDLENLAERFHNTLAKLVATREELTQIEDQLSHILMTERDEQTEKLAELTEVYEATQRKIHALEGLKRSREAARDETTIMDLLTSAEPLEYEEEEDEYEEYEDYESEGEDDEYDEYDDVEDEGDFEDELDEDEEEEEELAECGSCGALIDADATECPECGISFEEEEE